MKKIIHCALVLTILLAWSGCFTVENKFEGLPPGPWRAVLKLEEQYITPNPKGEPLPDKLNMKFDEVTAGELPFNFTVVPKPGGGFYVELRNGEETLRTDDIVMGLDRRTAKDTITIRFPEYDTYLEGIYTENVIQGHWVVNYKENYSIPFVARFGEDHRFTKLRKEPIADISGRWEVMFQDEDEPYPAIGEFKQVGNYLTGTFLTETGDYRYLEGTVQADKVYLSVFDGAHAFLMEAKLKDANTMIGSFASGTQYKVYWEAKRNSEARLRNASELTYLNPGYDRLSFAFPNTQGRMVSITDEAYRGQVTIVQIFGTWCPNCRDETEFLKQYLADNPSQQPRVLALAFERYKDEAKNMERLRDYKTRVDVPYEMLLAGYYNKQEAAQKLPALNHVLSYPTMIFVDKTGKVRKIHTGFSGPATSEYAAFRKEFDETVKGLMAE